MTEAAALSGGSRSSALLEALTAKHRSPLRRFEGHSGFLAALRAVRPGLSFCIVAGSCNSQRRSTLRFTILATFGFVLKLLVVEKQLFPSGKDEVRAAVHALQHLVLEFHGKAPFNPAPLRPNTNPTLEDDGTACEPPRFQDLLAFTCSFEEERAMMPYKTN